MATEKQITYFNRLREQWIERAKDGFGPGGSSLFHEIFSAYQPVKYPDLDFDDLKACESVEAETMEYILVFFERLNPEKWDTRQASAWIDALKSGEWADYLRKKIAKDA